MVFLHRPAMAKPTVQKPGVKLVASNRQVPYKYHVLERYEAGMVLTGTEVKALREGRANLRDAYALVRGGELWLLNLHISAYSHSGYASHDPLRTRKLLLHKQEIGKLAGRVEQKGLALVALRLYFKNGRAKCELALVKGKKVYDRREEVRRRVVEREMEQELKRYR
jgi:SsrA-binding protein